MNAARPYSLSRIVTAMLLAACATAWAADPKASQFYEDALMRFDKKDVSGAIVQLKNALKIDNKMLPVHVLLGRALLANGELNAAEAAFDEALKLGVNPSEVLLPLAEAVTAQGKPGLLLSEPRFAHAGHPPDLKSRLLLLKAAAASDLGATRDALKFLEEARTLDAASAESWVAEVPIRVRARQPAEAKAAADKAVALDPKSPKAAYQQATVAHVTGNLKSAVDMYSRTLALKPDHIDALVARGGLYIDMNRIPEATADVQAARKADPKDPRSAYLSALLAEKTGNPDTVKKALLEVTNLFDPIPMERLRYRPQVLILGGLAHFGLDQYEKAKPYLEMVQRQDANSPVSKLLAKIYLQEKRVDKAIESLELYLRTRPEDTQAAMLLASSQMAQGRYARSTQIMQEALKKGDAPNVRTMLGVGLVGSGKFAEGAAELEAALKKDPTQIQAGVSLTSLYISSGQGAKAVTVAEALVKQQPKNPGLVNLLGSAQIAKGDVQAARTTFEQASKLDPSFPEPQINLARLEIDQKALESARKRLNAVIAKNEKNVDAMMELARLYSADGQPEESQRWLVRAEDNSGQGLGPALQMVDFQLARGRPDLAKEATTRLQNKAPEALPVLLAIARVQMAAGDPKEARSTLTRASTLVGFDAASLTRIAEMQLQADNVPGAVHALDKALSTNPMHLRARALRTTTYMLQGDMAKAEQTARGVTASDPKLGMGHSLLGDLAMARKQPSVAVEAYKRAHQLDRNSESLLRLFAATDQTQHATAVSLAENWLREKPEDLRVRRSLADSQARSGNFAAARTAYEGLLKHSPKDAEALNNLAIVLVTLGDASATQVADRALALKPQAAHILGTAGWAALHAGQNDRALQLLRDARLRDPNNINTRYFLASALAKQGRASEAKQELLAATAANVVFTYSNEAHALLKTLN